MNAIKDGLTKDWLRFDSIPTRHKTQVWRVVGVRSGNMLGFVKWYGAWRQYTFFPQQGTLFNPSCLRQLADFCESRTRERTSEPHRKTTV